MTKGNVHVSQYDQSDDFIRRHVGPGDEEISAMLEALDLDSLETLVSRAVPESIRSESSLDLPGPRTEVDVLSELRTMGHKNRIFKSMIGLGYHGTITPPVILRNVLENPGWYTAYTPYQPEISQGRLEALLNYQTMITDLTGMELTNASLLDEGTAAAEAMTMCRRVSKADGNGFFVSSRCLPQTIDVVKTRALPLGIDIIVGDEATDLAASEVFGALLQYPDVTGAIPNYDTIIADLHAQDALAVVAADLLSLVLLRAPGEFGADVVVGNSQRFGVPLGFGGPHAAFLATRDEFRRTVPGRIVGQSVDSRGRPAHRLALQTREQHIRREKATSNICTAQVLLAVMAGMYAVWHGPEGLRDIARRVHRFTAALAAALGQCGLTVRNETFFDTLTVEVSEGAQSVIDRAQESELNLRRVDDDTVGITFDETATMGDVAAVFAALSGGSSVSVDWDQELQGAESGIPKDDTRTSAFLDHEIFHLYRSETEMLRYLARLQAKDIALDRSMIPLGSCTMKLNATTEMLPVTWPEFSNIHPFAPLDQAAGYLELIHGLQHMLAEISGFDTVSLQPNAGSQGEYAGLWAIRAWHHSRGEEVRDVCLIPSSAHGTNPASAVMAGCEVVVVDCDSDGNIDVADLAAKAEHYTARLAALMVTYPSTHGVFEERIKEICEIIHVNGGQVYMDGANLNALVGISRPADLGADVMHFNLHKTFCIPHGGGGPGMGPIGAKSHLAPFMPNHPLIEEAGPETGVGPISAGPWGSALILPISWAYIALMGDAGLRKATEVAILNANYMARRLEPHYPVVYRGQNDFVAHECIIDCRRIQDDTGVTVEDIAKRLMDYGFHAPTMSWPVAGALMIEPTESESRHELDRFCDAMISIREEISEIERGEADAEDNLLHNAPHTMDDIADAEWTHPYSRERAVFPVPGLRESKYWPPVNRIDQVYGDRHLICVCPPLEAYAQAAE
ncbi:MAG: glycine dehydrogenase (aminomethyl-transferring) [Alphaproteobacteria bacterium]|nr:glycine dehydrogenase (aminomethyl-transferring) [Alphaproteobacteria bacterium]